VASAPDRNPQAVPRAVVVLERGAKALHGDHVADDLLGQARVPQGQQGLPVQPGRVAVIDGLIPARGRGGRDRLAPGLLTVSRHRMTPVTSGVARSANARSHQGLEWFSQRTTGKIASGGAPRA
jgi:hypothetical protein